MSSRKRMSLVDQMEHIAELEELKDLVDDDEDDELEGSALDRSSMPSAPPTRDGNEDEEEDEDDEEVVYTAEDLGYEWQGEPDEEDLGYEDLDLGYEDQSQVTGSSSLYEEGDSNAESSQTSLMYNSQQNNNMMRRVSGIRGSAASGNSFSSAPEHIGEESVLLRDAGEAQRRSTFTGPPAAGLSRRISSRRQNINLGSIAASGMNSMSNLHSREDDPLQESGSMLQKIKNSTFGASQRRSTAMRNRRQGSSMSLTGPGSELNSIQQAASRLESGPDSVFAAASVVAQSAQVSAKRGHVQFNTDDAVLCMLTLLNVTNPGDDTDSFTVCPVNIHGYPPGEGKTEAERQGPYVFVMATVKKVHFDEDERYYTIVRADNGTEQRADTGWMEPLRDPDGIEAARRAAEETGRAMKEKADQVKTAETCGQMALSIALVIFALPLRFAMKLIPWYRRSRAFAKVQVTHLLHGDSAYACRFRLTGINVLVICSFIFLFIENVKLAFVPASWDYEIAIIGVVVWCILALELVFEYLIRPFDYGMLVESDQAYAPSTARHINLYHLAFEAIALILFIPEFICMYKDQCGGLVRFSSLWASVHSVDGSDSGKAVLSRLCLGLTSLRLFGLVRHWKQMWINNTFTDKSRSNLIRRFLLLEYEGKGKGGIKDEGNSERAGGDVLEKSSTEEDQRLKNAATIGTALMVVNSHRALLVLVAIVTILPMIISYKSQNYANDELMDLLYRNNILAAQSPEDCNYLKDFVESWLLTAESTQPESSLLTTNTYLLWAEVWPKRCGIQGSHGQITLCDMTVPDRMEACDLWHETSKNENLDVRNLPEYFAKELDVRIGGIRDMHRCYEDPDDPLTCKYEVRILFNDNFTIAYTNLGLFILLAALLILTIFGLTVMRNDAGRLVLDPLRRMLKIVVRYAENPLMETGELKGRNTKGENENGNKSQSQQLGNYETEQLINAIAKIADLLRKCWGVAGAGIISTNLARTKEGKTVVFNPTVPGKRVYALFGFVAINGFDKTLHALDRDVMILINDVAKVVHDEVYRWALGDSGQCNRNLGAAFLMVFRIGDFNEIHNKKKLAQDVVFNSHGRSSNRKSTNALRKRKTSRGKNKRSSHRNIDMGADGTLQLASLPGIQSFTDRALLGMLKSYAGIHRDKNLLNWKKDWRLGAGVGAFSVSVIYGMDAGWAVEGAVGSEYKIDATYLSPHVNMASRMMSATKQYGVTILLSQAVEELLSKPARAKLRHLDTVFVKGSSVAQRIFTFDARHEGVDFFLFERSPEKADRDAELYTDKIWETDQDLRSMRQHVKDEFMERFREGVEQYLDGKWKLAIENLAAADDMMIQTVIEEGYIDFDPEELGDDIFDRSIRDEEIVRIRTEYGDGACKCLINYMERRNGIPPKDWVGVRKLDSK